MKLALILLALLEGATAIMWIGIGVFGSSIDHLFGAIFALGFAATITQLFLKYRSAQADQITLQRD